MASGSITLNLDTTRYSAPVPVIGLYIAAGSSVCLFLMLFDVISSYRRRQSWIPCRFFKLNSFTLTMLSIATKLQVDLTTPMPGVPDQLSKLTGTTLLCICMGFFNPSVANNKGSEYLSNLAALSIMIITIVVNICIQFYTGVIHLFITEHIIIMCCTFLVLFLMWACANEAKVRNQLDTKNVTSRMSDNGNRSLLERLKSCYAIGFDKNPQLRACRSSGNLLLALFCLVSISVLVQAIVRSVVLKQLRICGGSSDYDWSTWFILIMQCLTIIVGCVAICFRWFVSFPFVHPGLSLYEFVENDKSMGQKFITTLRSRSCYKLGICIRTSLHFVFMFLQRLVLIPLLKLLQIFGCEIHEIFKEYEEPTSSVKKFIRYADRDMVYQWYPCNRTMEKMMLDFDSCIEESSRDFPELLKLISRTSPSRLLINYAPEDDMASPLPLSALVKTAITCLPEALMKTILLCC